MVPCYRMWNELKLLHMKDVQIYARIHLLPTQPHFATCRHNLPYSISKVEWTTTLVQRMGNWQVFLANCKILIALYLLSTNFVHLSFINELRVLTLELLN